MEGLPGVTERFPTDGPPSEKFAIQSACPHQRHCPEDSAFEGDFCGPHPLIGSLKGTLDCAQIQEQGKSNRKKVVT